MSIQRWSRRLVGCAGLALTGLLVACGGGGEATLATHASSGEAVASVADRPGARTIASATAVVEETRPQGSRPFWPDTTQTTFDALADTATQTDRWAGVLNGAGYHIEVPTNWNGKLVMWAHGYVGPISSLIVLEPFLRRHFIEHGYAWAASSYSKNYYDVRAGVEDTNALALEFVKIAAANGRVLAEPTKVFIGGVSMGGHVTAAAIEEETQATAVHKMKYAGALPMCGNVGGADLFNFFAAYRVAAQQLAGVPVAALTVNDFTAATPAVKSVLWTSYPSGMTAQGDKLQRIVMNLTGGQRDFFALGWGDGGFQAWMWSWMGSDGTLDGVLNTNIMDASQAIYRFDTVIGALSAAELRFNSAAFRGKPAASANRLRADGLRWVPAVNGAFNVPVVSLHTLGDLTVPFSMEQVYRRRANATGSDKWLVQRAIRDVGHCSFTVAEAADAFDSLVKWEAGGAKPGGDDVMNPATVASHEFGCKFTNNTTSADDTAPKEYRSWFQGFYPPCPSR